MNSTNNKKKIFDKKYEILEIVGRGDSSVVYHAKTLSEKKDVAIKVLLNKGREDIKSLLRKESLTLVSCNSPYVVKLDDFKVIDNICYLVLEYAQNRDLLYYSKEKALTTEYAKKILSQALQGLEFIHSIGVIHRDISPENLLIMDDLSLKIGDFGSSKIIREVKSESELKQGVKKTNLLAPEYLTNERINFSSDLYSLGVTFFYILTGSTSLNFSLIDDIKLRTLLIKMTKKDSKERFQDAKEALDFLLSDEDDIFKNSNNAFSEDKEQEFNKFKENLSEFLEDVEDEDDDEDEIHEQYFDDDEDLDEELEDDEYENNDDVSAKAVESNTRDNIKNSIQDDDFNVFLNKLKNNEEEENRNKEESKSKVEYKDIEDAKSPFSFNKTIDNIDKIKDKVVEKQNFERRDKKTFEKINKENLARMKQRSSYNSFNPQRRRMLTLFFIFLFFILLYSCFKNKNTNEANTNKFDVENVQNSDVANTENVEITFPMLPDGVYYGKMQNILVNDLNFIVSVNDNNALVDFKNIGIKPFLVRTDRDDKSLTLNINGVVLTLFEEGYENGVLYGNVVNKITGEKGTWKIKLVKK